MPKLVSVRTLKLAFDRKDLDSATSYLQTWWERPFEVWNDETQTHEKFIQVNLMANNVINEMETRLAGDRTAKRLNSNVRPRVGVLYHLPIEDFWFIEVRESQFDQPKYVELSREEAMAWLTAFEYSIPTPNTFPVGKNHMALEASTSSVNEPVRGHIDQSLPRKTLEEILHSLRFQQSRAERLAEKWTEYQHWIIKYKPDEAVGDLRLTESYAQFDPRTCHVFEPNPPIWRYGHIWRGVNPFYHGLEVWRDLAEISEDTVRVLEDSGRMTRHEMPPEFDREGQRNRWPCRLLEFVHYHADQNRHGSLLRSTRVYEFNGLEIPGGVQVWKLRPGIFSAIAAALEIEVEGIEERLGLGVADRPQSSVPLEMTPATTETPDVGNRTSATVAIPKPIKTIDYDEIVASLRMRRSPAQARLVDFMKERKSATFLAIGEYVHDDGEPGATKIRNNVNRTNDSLVELGIPLTFTCANEWVYKQESPE